MIRKLADYATIVLAVFIVVSVIVIGCGSGGGGLGPPPLGADPVMLFEGSDTIRLGWTRVTTNINGEPTYLHHYNLFMRVHGTTPWVLLQEVPDVAFPWVELDHTQDAKWDFAVSAVDYNNQESTLHTSLDENAIPQGGWYLLWDLSGDAPPYSPSSIEKRQVPS